MKQVVARFGNTSRCFRLRKFRRAFPLPLAHRVLCVRITAGGGTIGSHIMPGGDHRNGASPRLSFPLFSPPTSMRRKRQTRETHSMKCHLPLSGSRGRRSSVNFQQPPFLPYLLAMVSKCLSIKETQMSCAYALEPLHLRDTSRCPFRGGSQTFAFYHNTMLG
jgi:hypothetical protein